MSDTEYRVSGEMKIMMYIISAGSSGDTTYAISNSQDYRNTVEEVWDKVHTRLDWWSTGR